ncbi:alpha/beta hydrolase [Thalassobius vesicularis]|uniref:Alpha/beta hydrolase n=1 Tax=Thalassobius vesicularis TaxID=1294297 RepID=A0A4S3M743_9RHOB|nr:alpha/beta hydrolase [Thalassobius vesicularis]THD72999.1 alpha/beta hydrolase [Thalassobius vesicularis]
MAKFTTSDGVSIHYEDQGSGLPILCLAGLTRNARDFDFVAPHLPGVRLIRMDYRGRGQSGWAEDYSTYSIPRETQDVLELMAHLSLDKVAILGTSRGGLIGMVMAATAKDRLLGVALNDVGPELNMAGLANIMTYLGVNPDAKTLDDYALMRAQMPGFANVPAERWRTEVTHTFVQTRRGVEINYDPRLRDAVAESLQSGDSPDLWPLFAAIAPLPCAVIHGANSDLLTAEAVDKMAAVLPGLIVAHVPDRGHVPFLDEPQALDALTHWIKALQ